MDDESYFDDPTRVVTPDVSEASAREPIRDTSLEKLLRTQMQIADKVQRRIAGLSHDADVREFRDLVAAANTLVANAHRAHESLRELATYREFVEVVVEFIRSRQDSFGDDLLAHLREVSRTMRAETTVETLLDL